MVVAVPITLATRWLIPRLGGFREAHPGLVLRLSTFDRPADAIVDADVTLNDIRSGGLGADGGSLLFEDVCVPAIAPRLLDGAVASGSAPIPWQSPHRPNAGR